MLDDLFAYALTAVIVLGLAAFMRQRGWGIALPLIALGAVVGLAPFGPAAPPEPEVILILLLAPLVFGEALSSSYLDLRRVSRPVLALAIGLVLTATLVVGGVVSLFVAMPLAVAFALGAIVSPTDAVAVGTIAKRASLPRRMVSILEGESLVNDGTGLTALRVAVVAAVAGSVTLVACMSARSTGLKGWALVLLAGTGSTVLLLAVTKAAMVPVVVGVNCTVQAMLPPDANAPATASDTDCDRATIVAASAPESTALSMALTFFWKVSRIESATMPSAAPP